MNANIIQAQEWIAQADAILIGASNGLSIAEGYHIFANNEMFRRQFGDVQQQYGFRNVVEGLYFQYPTAESTPRVPQTIGEVLGRRLQTFTGDA